MKQTVVGVFDQYSAAQHAADLLRERGIFDHDDVRITAADDTGTAPSGSTVSHEDKGLMERIRDFFSGAVDDDDEVSVYSEHVRRGGAVLKVQVEDEAQVEVASEVLEAAGAVDVDKRVDEWQSSGWVRDSRTSSAPLSAASPASTTAGTARTGSDRTDIRSGKLGATGERSDVLPVVREEMQVGKRTLRAGGVRVYSRIVEDPVHESVELREEAARVERRPVDRPASEADLSGMRERTIEVEETVERPVVQKVARVVEEVVVGKDVRQKTVKIDDTVRHTEVEVENLPGGASAGAVRAYEEFDTDFRSDFKTRYGASGRRFEDVEPAYRYGHSLASDSRYSGKRWDDIETDVGRDWTREHPGSTWEEIKASVRHAWERATR
ncbi:MAG TPA: YsnF/AvaK domain-containing protein [Burkholderiaceae bacterium]|jgi:uncharacterized protein (TIGR02271 family)|nr:YsnF/AvaK domain-containing protein [Burkholderiaceae bacterium]